MAIFGSHLPGGIFAGGRVGRHNPFAQNRTDKVLYTAGIGIDCAGTGQDGEMQAGVACNHLAFFNCKLHEIVGK